MGYGLRAPNLRGKQIAEGALSRLANRPRRVVQDLEQLSRAWFTMGSCIVPVGGRAPSADPTSEGLRLIVRYADASDDVIASKALLALEAAAKRWAWPRTTNSSGRPDIGDWPGWANEGLREVVSANLGATVFAHRRLHAAAILAAAPVEGFPLRHLARADIIYHVRWRAIRALVLLGERSGIGALLTASRPRGFEREGFQRAPDSMAHWEYGNTMALCMSYGVDLEAGSDRRP